MGLNHSPQIYTDNIHFCMDILNLKSYPGSGSVLTDITGKSGYDVGAEPVNQIVFPTGVTNWTVPDGVTEISIYAVGGGGGAGGAVNDPNNYQAGAGGAGGSTSYATFYVTPGETLTVTVGAGGVGGQNASTNAGLTTPASGGDSTVYMGQTLLVRSNGGGAGSNVEAGGSSARGGTASIAYQVDTNLTVPGTANFRTRGGTGGSGVAGSGNTGPRRGGGGGGAGGYTDYGRFGQDGSDTVGISSINHDAANGGNSDISNNTAAGNGGGGVGIFGAVTSIVPPNGGGSGGLSSSGSTGGLYGGGGGAAGGGSTSANSGSGADGTVRIIWGSGRTYPSTNTANATQVLHQPRSKGRMLNLVEDIGLGYFGFDGNRSNISFEKNILPTNYENLTIECWIRLDTTLNSDKYVVCYAGTVTPIHAFLGVKYDATYNNFRGWFGLETSSGLEEITSTNNIDRGKWYHLVGTYERGTSTGTLNVYVNGEKHPILGSSTIQHSNYAVPNNNRLLIGTDKEGDQNNAFQGNIALVRTYLDTLSDDDVLKNYYAILSRASSFDDPEGQVVFTSFNTTLDSDFSWVVPAGTTQISAVCVGGGGGGGGNDGTSGPGASAGGGGGLAYATFFVTPGETLTLRVGSGGAGGLSGSTGVAGSGGDTYIMRSSTILLQGSGGNPGTSNSTNALGGTGGGYQVGTETDGGGPGGSGGNARNNGQGAGGGGAGGYSGAGGGENTNGLGGGGAGGVANNGINSTLAEQNGGGVALYGEGTSGTTTTALSRIGSYDLDPGTGDGRVTTAVSLQASTFGGGGGGIEDDTNSNGHSGGSGGIRIIWGDNRSYPSTNVADV